MSKLVFDKEVELRPHTIDHYGRLVARWRFLVPRLMGDCRALINAIDYAKMRTNE